MSKQQCVFRQLQLNLIRSHATGYGAALTPEQVRMLLALRINILAKGHSGQLKLIFFVKILNRFQESLSKTWKNLSLHLTVLTLDLKV
jgi:histidine ammonia-lyase